MNNTTGKMAAGSFADADEWRGLTRISLNNDSLRAGHRCVMTTTGKSPAIFMDADKRIESHNWRPRPRPE